MRAAEVNIRVAPMPIRAAEWRMPADRTRTDAAGMPASAARMPIRIVRSRIRAAEVRTSLNRMRNPAAWMRRQAAEVRMRGAWMPIRAAEVLIRATNACTFPAGMRSVSGRPWPPSVKSSGAGACGKGRRGEGCNGADGVINSGPQHLGPAPGVQGPGQ